MLLALDAGGTSTRCVVATRSGRIVGYGEAGPGNAASVGTEAALAARVTAAASALESAELPGRRISAVTAALAGFRPTGEIALDHSRALGALGVTAPITFVSDALAGFCSGTVSPDGYVLIVGTGAAAVRIADRRLVATADGAGWLLGDLGSGYWIGSTVVRAVIADIEARGPTTELTGMLSDQLGLRRDELTAEGRIMAVEQLFEHAYSRPPVWLGRFAGLAFRALPDRVANDIVDAAAQGIATTLTSVLTTDAAPVVATGGVIVGEPELQRRVTAELAARGHPIRLIPVQNGLAGSVSLALRAMGIEIDEGLLANIRDEVSRIGDAETR